MAQQPNPMEINAQQRARLLAGSQRFCLPAPLNNLVGLGGHTAIKAQNIGVTTGFWLEFTATVNIDGLASVSKAGPYALVKRISLIDYSGNTRVDCTGPQLWLYNSVRNNAPFGYNNQAVPSTLDYGVTVPDVGGDGQKLRFYLYVPCAYSETDLRGAILTQVNTGELRINIEFASTITSSTDTTVYSSGTVSLVGNIEVRAYQDYLNPAINDGIRGAAVPPLDVMTIHEVLGVTSKTDIATGTEALISYPNGRAVFFTSIHVYLNGLLKPIDTSISRFRLLANGATNIQDRNGAMQGLFQRTRIDSDLQRGMLFQSHFASPMQTDIWGQLQHGITFDTAITDQSKTYMQYMFCSFVMSGQAQQGFAQ